MADNEVVVTFLAKATDLLAALDKTATAIQKNQASLAKMGAEGKRAGDDIGLSFEKSARSAVSWGAGLVGVQGILGSLIRESQKLYDITDKAALRLADFERKFAVQSGLRGLESKAAQSRILDIAGKNAVTGEFANQAATALASGGFSATDASGDALDVFLQATQASLKAGEDPTGLAQSAGQFLAAQNMPKNAANLKRIMVASQQLFKTTDFQISDLTNLAGKSQGAAGIMSPEEVLGTFNIMRDKTTADVASTGFKILLERLQTAKGDRESVSALGRMKLKPGDVDLIGENMPTVLDRLAGGLDALKPEDRPVVMEKLFGKEALSPITGLIRDRAKLGGNVAAMGDVKGFEEDVAAATGGKVAGRVRLEEEEKRAIAARDTGFEDKLLAARKLSRELLGTSEFGLTVSSSIAKATAGTMRVFGASDETAESTGLSLGFGAGGKFRGEIENTVEGSRKSAAEQTALLERIARAAEKPPPVVIKPDAGRRAVPVAAGRDAGVRAAP